MAEIKHSTPYPIPLTSNTAPAPFEASASTSSWGAFRAFTESLTDDWAATGMSETSSQWVQIKLDQAIRIWGFKISVRTTITAQDAGQLPYNFKIHGSQDGSSFTEIYSCSAAPKEWFVVYDAANMKYDWASPQMIEISTGEAYQYYRFEFFNCQTIDKTNSVTSTLVNNVKITYLQLFQVEGTPGNYTVEFKDWDGTSLKTETVEPGKSATAPSDPHREGYTFAGWDKDFSNVQSNLIVTAVYEIITVRYTVTFLDWDDTVLKTESVPAGGNATAPPNPTRDGYTFSGWNKSFQNIQSDITVKALYKAVAGYFTVTFLDWDETVLKAQSVEQGSNATPPLPPFREGYAFDHWSDSFLNIQSDMRIWAVYRIIRDPAAIKIYREDTLVQTIRNVISAKLHDSLDGELAFEFTTLMDQGGAIKSGYLAEFEGRYFNIVRVSKSISSGMMLFSATCEHVSNVLNDDCYNLEEFDFTGPPASGLQILLNGTQLLPGTVEYSDAVTMKINKKCTRRAALMQYIAILGGEIEYSGNKINILKHRGSNAVKELLDHKNVTDVSVISDIRSNTESYDVKFHKKSDFSIGDEVHIAFDPLQIDTLTRIISIEYNPFYSYSCRVEVGNYRPSINDSLYRLEQESNSSKEIISKIQTDYDNFKNTYKEVRNLTVGDSTFSVTFSDGSMSRYSYSVDSAGRITSISKGG